MDCINSLVEKLTIDGHSANIRKYVGYNSLECESDRKIVSNNWVIEEFQHETSHILINSNYVKLK